MKNRTGPLLSAISAIVILGTMAHAEKKHPMIEFNTPNKQVSEIEKSTQNLKQGQQTIEIQQTEQAQVAQNAPKQQEENAQTTIKATHVPSSNISLDQKVNQAIERFKKEIIGGEKFLTQVKGYLVFPQVIKGGIVIGGEYGKGVLVVDGVSKYHYSIASGSVGFQLGLQKTSYVIAFVTEDALNSFIKSNGWEAGVDGSITISKWGAGKDISSITYEKPIYAFVFGSQGLMYNLTLEGTKFSRIEP